MFIKKAHDIAQRLIASMLPYCERIEIAGSIRRGCQEVKDIELVAVAKWELAPVEEQIRDLFGSPPQPPANFNLLHFWALNHASPLGVRWIKTGTSEVVSWLPKPEGKYWRALVGEGTDAIKLDLFIARADNYGLIKLIRTGSRDFSPAVLGYAKRHTPYQTESSYFKERKKKGEPESYLVERATGKRVPTPEETDVFNLLSLQYVEPAGRIDGSAVRPLAQAGSTMAAAEASVRTRI